jgi:hypothetical protein
LQAKVENGDTMPLKPAHAPIFATILGALRKYMKKSVVETRNWGYFIIAIVKYITIATATLSPDRENPGSWPVRRLPDFNTARSISLIQYG